MDGLPSNLEQMLSPLKCDNIFITSVFSSKAVKQCYDITTIYMYHFIENYFLKGLLFYRCYKSRIHFPSFFSQNNLNIDLTYTTHNLNNFNKYPSITCSYIQEYLGYQSNNLYFLFSHS